MSWLYRALLAFGVFVVLTGAVCNGMPLDSTHDVIVPNSTEGVELCAEYHGFPIIIGDTFICRRVDQRFYPF